VTQLAASYGYPALALIMLAAAAGIPLPVPVAALLVAAGALSAQPHGLSWALLALCGVPAAAAGHSLDYWLGRAGSPLVTRWMRRVEHHTIGGIALHRTRAGSWAVGPLLVFLTRWTLTALASPVAALAGAVRMPYRVFLAAEVAGEAIYVCGLLALGRLLGPALPHDGFFAPALWIGLAVVLIVAATALLPRLWRRLRAGGVAGG
jgi:membrane-associated protein